MQRRYTEILACGQNDGVSEVNPCSQVKTEPCMLWYKGMRAKLDLAVQRLPSVP